VLSDQSRDKPSGMLTHFWKNSTLFRFLLVGGINTLVGYGIFALFIFLGLHYTLASLLGTLLSILFNYFSTGRLVFREKGLGKIPRFYLGYLVGYLISLCALFALDRLGVDTYLAGAITILAMVPINYFLNKNMVFRA
jgi:putative flippase GtrA